MSRNLRHFATNIREEVLNKFALQLPLFLLVFLTGQLAYAQAQINVSFTVEQPSCFGLPNGKVTAVATGGIAPYTYMWDTGVMTPALNGITAGTYMVTVMDSGGNSVSRSVTVEQPPLIAASIGVAANCGGPFDLTAQGGGGVQPYKYYWSTGSSAQSITVNEGTYCVTVTDTKSCGAVKCITVNNIPLTSSATAQGVTCPDGEDGKVTANPAGGMMPYKYAWSNGDTTQMIQNLASGSYTVTVTDSKGCKVTASASVANRQPIDITFTNKQPTCTGNTDGMVVANVTGGSSPYTYLWNTSATTQGLFGVGAGIYKVTITDNKGCVAIDSVLLEPKSKLSITVIASDEACPDAKDGSVKATPSNSTGPYKYSWSNGDTTQTIINLAPGIYSVTVTDFFGCTATGVDTVKAAAGFAIAASGTDVTSCEANDGTAMVSVTAGIPPFKYTWSTGDTTQAINDLDGGEYIVTVKDARGCMKMDTITIGEPPAVFVNIAADTLICPDSNNGTAKAVVSGGTAPFTFAWSTGASIDSIINLSAGTYSVTVTDASGCMAVDTIKINESPMMMMNIVGDEAVCGENGKASVTAQTMFGVPPYSFLWSNGMRTQTIIGLPAGTYSVIVTDANGCQAFDTINIVATILETTIRKQDVLCFGENSGYATVDVTGGTEPYTYAWSNAGTTDSIGGLGIGTYRVTVTDANGCSAIDSVTINQPSDISLDIVADTLVCTGTNDGFAKAVVTGGTTPYTFAWSNAATTDSIGNLGAGTYRVTVTDANGCTKIDSVTIVESPGITLQVESTEIVCGAENNGEASVTVTGGQAPYTYAWSNGDTTNMIEDLTGGTYIVTVTDANGCSAVAEATVRIISDFGISVVPRNVLCNGDNSGSILVTPSGGDAPYTFNWSNGASSSELTNITVGTYTVTVTEANGCSLTQTVMITQPTALTSNASGTNLTCFQANDGAASVVATGGTQPYSYAWSNGRNTAQITGLAAGNYTVTVTDANFCTTTSSITITQPNQLTAIVSSTNILCHGENSGSANVTILGGTSPYSYSWSNGATTASIANLTAGTYTLTVTDAKECTTSVTVTINEPTALQLSLTVNNIVCTSEQIGSISTVVAGGVQPYTYAWNNGATTASISNLPGGTYSVTVTDANGCTMSDTTGVAQIPNLELTTTKTDVTCFGEADGTATVMASGDAEPYAYLWNTGDTTAMVTGLTPGTYTVTVRGAAGCIGEDTITIAQPAELALSLSKVNPSCNDGANGQATATPTGGTSPYSYTWDNGASTAVITGLSAGTYNVTVTDANECSTTGMVTIEEPDSLTVTLEITQGTCQDETGGSITATPAGGTGPYTYKWSNNQTGATISNLGQGTYSVTITDANSCTTTGSIILNAFNKPVCTTIIVQEEDVPGANNGIAQVIAEGGTGPYTYLWEDGQTTQTATGLGIGVYGVTVTDANGCSTSCQVELKAPARIGDFVWLDLDQDGIQDPGEPGIGGVTVIVTGVVEDEPYADTTVTNANGLYGFDVPPPGNYKITFILPPGSGLKPTTQNAGSDDAKDSDVDPVMLMTQVVFIQRGDVDLTLDAGFHEICSNLTNAGTIGYDQYLCGPGNDPLPIIELTSPVGGAGPIEYLWMRSTIGGPFNNTNWEPIPNSNTRDYDPGPIYETTYFIRCTRRKDCPYIETNIVAVIVGNETVAEITSPNVFCQKTLVTLTAAGEGPNAAYQWDLGPAATPRYVTGQSVKTTFSSFGTFEIKLAVTTGNCTSVDLQRITVSSLCGGLAINADVVSNQEILVAWAVPEDGLQYEFDVQHSNDGQAFETIARVNTPHHTTGSVRFYEYMDETPRIGWNYYRVRAVDNTNREAVSDVAQVALFGDSKLMHFYPNPVTDQLTIEILDSLNDDIQMQVVNANGTLMQTIDVPKDADRQDLDFSRLPSGTYFIKVRYGKIDVKVLKVLKP